MKKKIAFFLLIIIVIGVCIITYKKMTEKNDNKLTKIKVAEVTHSMFYAPLYAAIENGYFKDNDLDIEIILTPGADKVSAAVLSNDVQIGLAGPESTIYVYNAKESDYLITFSGLTKRDGQFILSRNKIDNFSTSDLINKHILVGRIGGMPSLSFENALKNTNIVPSLINIDYSVDYASLSGAFIGGNGDFVNLFEPLATKLEKEGYGYVVASVGDLAGPVPYTAFYSRKSFLENNQDLIKKFTDAIAKGLKFVEENDAKTIAQTIINQFPDSSLEDVTTIVDRYKKCDSWLSNPYISEESFNNLQDIMISANQIDEYVDYNKLIQNIHKP